MGRLTSWKHADGDDATSAALTQLILPHVRELAAKGLCVYLSMEFKSAANQNDLAEHTELLTQLLANDPRGGHYDNHDVAAALRLAAQASFLHGTQIAYEKTLFFIARTGSF